VKRIFSFLALFVLVAGFAFANGGSNDLAYYKYSELKETASVGLTDEFIVVESNIPKKGGTVQNIVDLVTIAGIEDVNGDLSITRDLAVGRDLDVTGVATADTVVVTTSFTASGTSVFTGDMDVNGNIVGDGGGSISGMLSSVEIATTGDTLTVAEAGKTIIVEPLLEEYTTLTYVLPTPAAGIEFTFIAASNDTINVDPASTDTTIYYLTLDGGDKIVSPAATADSVTLIGYDSTSWGVKAMHGTWTDGS